jgi:hypothetical protein
MRKSNKYPKETLEPVVKKADSIGEVLRLLGFSHSSGSMFGIIKRRIKEYDIDTSHFHSRYHKILPPLKDVLVKGSLYSRHCLKRRIIKEGLLPVVCSICGLEPIWKEKVLVLVLDHINGSCTDNRIENLRLLCPNCNSQQDTFCSKNRNKEREVGPGLIVYPVKPKSNPRKPAFVENRTCNVCGGSFVVNRRSKKQKCCSLACGMLARRKVTRPSREKLLEEISTKPMTQIGKEYGVSSVSIKKWCQSYSIPLENRRGFWARARALEA